MIPKVIHYCWFGHNPLPKLAQKCINSWKKYLSDYEIKEWNEDNFDLDKYPYAKEAYENKKYAFVTDVVRLYALYHEGGIYMDTDVEVIGSLDPFLHHIAFSGFESETDVPTGIMASEKGGKWAKMNLDYYNDRHFIKENGEFDMTTNVTTITNLMLSYGLVQNNTYQDFPGLVSFYPTEYFCPIDHFGYVMKKTSNTVCIHYYAGSWTPNKNQFKKRVIRMMLGTSCIYKLVCAKKYIKQLFKK
ncbi:MAG: glycosyl transferase [Muribaculaceae bacterium]|nr:glycosyl transferase [Muribaculaceae bacterium]